MDLVIVTKVDHLYILNLSIKKILNFYNIDSVYIVSNKKYFKYFCTYPDINIRFIDEDSLLPNMTFDQLKATNNIPFFPKRAGWYFQQFLKLGIANLDLVSENYLVLDADTIFLKKVPLMDGHKYVFTKASEYNKPYFDNYTVLLKEDSKREFSFISQYMVFNKNIVKELLLKIEANYKFSNTWNWLIIKNLVGDSASLFSEYETYGNYIKNNYPELCTFIDLPWLRQGSQKLGSIFPKLEKIEMLKPDYYFVSFELNTASASYYRKIRKHFFLRLYPYYVLCKNKLSQY